MKTRRTTGLALATCLAFAAAACQAGVKGNAASKSPGVIADDNNDQDVTVTGRASNEANGKDSEQDIGFNNESSNSKDSKGSSSANTTSTSGASAKGETVVDDDDWKEVTADKNAAMAIAVGGNAIISNSGGTIHVKESVDQIAVTGSDVRVVAKTAKEISTQGSGVKVFIEQVSSVNFNESNDKIE